jgi:2-oxoglutarate dehydrogenase E1 component
VSTLADLAQGEFREVIDDAKVDPAGVRTVLLCSGKIYYELAAERAARKLNHVALVRMEQLYPWPAEALVQILARYPSNAQLVWVQEEPRNQGAWTFVFNQWMGGLDLLSSKMQSRAIYYVGRSASSSPAVGSPKLHALQQREIIEKALTV